MTDRPIIFSAPMVLALLAGRKTQTRRVLGARGWCNIFEPGAWSDEYVMDPGNAEWRARCTPYAPGDRLWVREACRAEELSRPETTRPATKAERDRLGRTRVIVLDGLDGADGVRYAADNKWLPIQNTEAASNAWVELYHYRGRGAKGIGNLVPSIHMPRWASRMTLGVTEVRVQRLHEISGRDAIAEGVLQLPHVEKDGGRHFTVPGVDGIDRLTAVKAFADLWNSLHGPDAWAANPWVVALTFTVERRNIDT